MTNLLWPGDHRAGELMTDRVLLDAMVAVESAWLHALAAVGLAPADAAGADLRRLVGSQDSESLRLPPRMAATQSSAWSSCCANAPTRRSAGGSTAA
jgi:hypothetical protein